VGARRQRSREPERELDGCHACQSRLVYPLRWRRLGGDRWQLELRCPECGLVWRECCRTAQVRHLDRVLGAGRRVLVDHLREIERLEQEAEVERFTAALAADAILPEDFGHAA
jgi:hypothetical protein